MSNQCEQVYLKFKEVQSIYQKILSIIKDPLEPNLKGLTKQERIKLLQNLDLLTKELKELENKVDEKFKKYIYDHILVDHQPLTSYIYKENYKFVLNPEKNKQDLTRIQISFKENTSPKVLNHIKFSNPNNIKLYLPSLKTISNITIPAVRIVELNNLISAENITFSKGTKVILLYKLQHAKNLNIPPGCTLFCLELQNVGTLNLASDSSVYLISLPFTEIKKLLDKCRKRGLRNISFTFLKEQINNEQLKSIIEEYNDLGFSFKVEPNRFFLFEFFFV